jgi:hypothetical protein
MQERNQRRSSPAIAIALAALLAAGAANAQTTTDFCGCAGSPDSLGDFVLSDSATYPPGTVGTPSSPFTDFFGSCDDAIRIPAPPDGVLVFDSMTVSGTSTRGCRLHLTFLRNAANTPITLLVKNDVTIGNNARINVSGFLGGHGTSGGAGAPGGPGAGGFAGGEGAYQIVNFASIGGNGIGPGGGVGATVTPAAFAQLSATTRTSTRPFP